MKKLLAPYGWIKEFIEEAISKVIEEAISDIKDSNLKIKLAEDAKEDLVSTVVAEMFLSMEAKGYTVVASVKECDREKVNKDMCSIWEEEILPCLDSKGPVKYLALSEEEVDKLIERIILIELRYYRRGWETLSTFAKKKEETPAT